MRFEKKIGFLQLSLIRQSGRRFQNNVMYKMKALILSN